jgi:uncharacterized membrane protein YphA (DoxX/SURF4 family)
MRDNPFAGFLRFMTGQIGDQVNAGLWRWPTLIVFWLLLLGAIAIAAWNWRQDPAQRSLHHLVVALLRVLGGAMWWCQSLWKLPLPVSAGFRYWLESTVKYSAWQWHADFMRFFLNHIVVVAPLIYLTEVSLAASLMLGLFVRLSNIIGALFILNLLIGLYNDPSEWIWTYIGLILGYTMFVVAQAGRSLGLDNIIVRRLHDVLPRDTTIARAVAWAA